jgi:hypothetical protein
MSITRVADTDDDGSGLTGTPRNNAWKTALYDQFDGRWTILVVTSTGTVNNLSLVSGGLEADLVLFSNATDLTLTGIVAPASPTKPGKPVRYCCIGAGNVFFAHQSGSSTAANRFVNILTGVNTPHAGGSGTGCLAYDGVNARWRLIQHEQGAWIPYTCTWGNLGTANSIGNGQIIAQYLVQGRVCFYRVSLAWGSTTTSGTSSWTFSLPMSSDADFPFGAPVWAFDWSAGQNYNGSAIGYTSSSVMPTTFTGTSPGYAPTVPFTWATNDVVRLAGWFMSV